MDAPSHHPAGAFRFAARRALFGGAVLLLQASAVVGVATAVQAQERTIVERQVPVDSTRSIWEIGPELRSELGLFSDIDGFQAARLFELQDGRTVLEISYRRDGRLWRERRELPPEVLASLRSHLAERLAEVQPDRPPPEDVDEPERREDPQRAPDEVVAEDQSVSPLNQEGRGRMILGETLIGLGFYGWAVPEVLDLDDERPVVAAYLLTAGASFYLPYRLTRNAEVSDAHRHMVLWGATRGALYGYLGASAATDDDDFGRSENLGAALGTSVAASYLGYRAVAWAADGDEGTSVLWTSLADAGTLAGFGIAYVAGFYDDVEVEREVDDPFGGGRRTVVQTEPSNPRLADLTALALTGAGLAGGRWLGTTDDYTVGDVSALRSITLLGAQAALPLAELTVGPDDERGKRYVAGMLAGGAAGIAAGSRILRGRSFSSSEGLILNAGHLAGGLAALGLTWLLTPDGEGHELLYTTTSAVGSAAGLALTYRALDPGREAEESEGSERGFRVDITPTALLAGVVGGASRDRRARIVPPLVRIRF